MSDLQQRPITPKFNCNRIDGCIIVSMNLEMAKTLVALLEEFELSELRTYEHALMKHLERLIHYGRPLERRAP